jgi:hypothetical protein
MKSVFILWHTHEISGESDEKLIGVYKSRKDAEAAIHRLSNKPGFKDTPDGFEMTEYILGKDHWTGGYLAQAEASQEQKH